MDSFLTQEHITKWNTAMPMIWTRVTDSISYDENCFTKRASKV